MDVAARTQLRQDQAQPLLQSLHDGLLKVRVTVAQGGTARASALACHPLICHDAEGIMVNIQRLMLASCKPQRDRVYSRFLGDGNDGDEWRMSDELFERTGRSAPTEQRDFA